MIGLVLVTHGRLAEEFRNAVEHVVGPQDNFETVAIGADDDMEQRRRDIVDAVARADTGAGVIVLTDMFGGTPSNLAISVMESGRVEVIAGMNLPMLIKLSGVRKTDDMAKALEEAQMAGRKVHQRRQPASERANDARLPRRPDHVRELPIVNQRGLHARASAKFVQLASSFRPRSRSRRTASRSAAPRSWA
jgi:PTS system mannose-specific IIA component